MSLFIKRGDVTINTRTKNRRNIQKKETQKLILESALTLFKELGFEKTSTRAIAEKACVGVGTVFSHFPDKSSLLIAVLLDDLKSIQNNALGSLPENIPICDKFLHISKYFYVYYAEQPELSRTLLKELWFVSGDWGQKLISQAHEFVFLLHELLEQAKQKGEIRPEIDTMLCARAFFSHYLNVLYEGMSDTDVKPDKMINLLKDLLNQLMKGVGSNK